jgi:hypothetical protein
MWPAQMLPKLPRWHAEGDLLVVAPGGREIALEVIHDLRRHPRPVDRIDRADLVPGLEGVVVGDRLHDVLGVVEHARDGDVEDVVVLQRIHLRALEGAHLAVRRQHEHAHAVLAAHRVFGRRAGVARGGAEDVDGLATLREHVLEQVAEQLHRHVLEGERRAVGQLEQAEAARPSASFSSQCTGVMSRASSPARTWR